MVFVLQMRQEMCFIIQQDHRKKKPDSLLMTWVTAVSFVLDGLLISEVLTKRKTNVELPDAQTNAAHSICQRQVVGNALNMLLTFFHSTVSLPCISTATATQRSYVNTVNDQILFDMKKVLIRVTGKISNIPCLFYPSVFCKPPSLLHILCVVVQPLKTEVKLDVLSC